MASYLDKPKYDAMGMAFMAVGKAEKSNAMSLTAQQKSIQRIVNLRKDSVVSKIHDIQIVICTDEKGRPCALTWFGRQQRPKDNYYFTSTERRDQYIERVTKAAAARMKDKEEKREKQKSFVPTFQVGDIYVSSWGYDQTNVDYYQVVEKASTHFAILRKIHQEDVPGSESNMSCKVTPIKDCFIYDDTHRVKITQCGDSQCIKLSSYKYAKPWNGKPNYKSWYA